MLKTISFLLVLVLVTSCNDDIQYAGATKIVFEGRLADASGNPQAGIFVSTSVQKEIKKGWFSYSTSEQVDVISYTTTDSNGYFRMIFPRPTNEDDIHLLINVPQAGYPYNEHYSNCTVTNIRQHDLDNYKIDFGTLGLANSNTITQLKVTLPVYYSGFQDVTIIAKGIVANNVLYYNVPRDESEIYHGILPYTNEQGSTDYIFTVAPNQEILFKYGPVNDTILQQVTIPIGTQDVNYTIE